MHRRLLLPSMLVLAAACGSGTDTQSQPLTLEGTWTQSAHLVDSVHGDDHAHFGSYAFAQAAGGGYTGTGQQDGLCSGAGTHYTGPLADTTTFQITNATLSGRTVSFQRDICSFSGSFVAGRNDRITGTATCAYTRNGVDYSFSGGWQADRVSN